jgi:hypothetical protein
MFPFLLGLFLVILIGGAVVAENHAREQRQLLFSRFADRSGGYLLENSLFSHRLAGVSLDYRGLPMTLEQTTTGGKHPVFYLEAKVDFRRFNPNGLRIEVYPQALFASLGKLLGMQDLEIGVADFDDRYILKSNDFARLKDFLDRTARGATDDLYYLLGNNDIYLHLDRHQFLVKKLGRVQQEGELDRFFQPCLPLIDRVLEVLNGSNQLPSSPDSEGIRFLEAGESPSEPPAEAQIQFLEETPASLPLTCCLVCGEELSGRVTVRCAVCHTAHHPDCWNFNGRCGVYGCSSRKHQRN